MPTRLVSSRFSCLPIIEICLIVCFVLFSGPALAWGTSVQILFMPKPAQGAHFMGTLTFDPQGNLYGVTEEGGLECQGFRKGCGSVLKLVPRPGGEWEAQILHRFMGGTDGQLPYAGVVLDSEGNLYGTTAAGGLVQEGGDGDGTVYEISPQGKNWKETILHVFAQQAPDGESPTGALTFDQNGNLYSTTYESYGCGAGTVFELSPNRNGGWSENLLYCFENGLDGQYPTTGVIFDAEGNLYSTTYLGGATGYGTAFELSPSGGGWTESVLYSFSASTGESAYAPLARDQAGNLYGITDSSVFELTPSEGGWSYSSLYTNPGGPNGVAPYSLMIDETGNLYSTGTGGSGNCKGGCGTVFKLTPESGAWQFTVLYNFPGGFGGEFPLGGLIMDGQGNLYGTTYSGGRRGCGGGGCGLVFELTP